MGENSKLEEKNILSGRRSFLKNAGLLSAGMPLNGDLIKTEMSSGHITAPLSSSKSERSQ
jgi:hypothetical protein